MNQVSDDDVRVLGRCHVKVLFLAFGIGEHEKLSPIMTIFIPGDSGNNDGRTNQNTLVLVIPLIFIKDALFVDDEITHRMFFSNVQ